MVYFLELPILETFAYVEVVGLTLPNYLRVILEGWFWDNANGILRLERTEGSNDLHSMVLGDMLTYHFGREECWIVYLIAL